MLYGWLFGILFALMVIGGIVLAIYGGSKEKKGVILGGIVGSIISFILFLCIPFSFHTVDSGEIAVVKEQGKIIDTREAGVHFDFWMLRKYEKYDTKVRQLDIVTSAYTAGDVTSEDDSKNSEEQKAQLQPVDVQMTLHYSIVKADVKNISLHYGNIVILESRLQAVATAKVKEVIKKYKAAELISHRELLAAEVQDTINQSLGSGYYVTINTVALTNIDFSDAFEQSVEQSMIAQQEIEKAKAEAEKAKAQAQGELEVAKKQAEAEVARAEAEAKAIKIKAEAEAEALNIQTLEVAKMLGLTEINSDGEEVIKSDLKLEEAQLIKEYIEYIKYLENWDGKLPTVMGGDSNSVYIPVNP